MKMELIGVFPAWRFVSALWTRLYVAGRAGAALATPASLPLVWWGARDIETGKSRAMGLDGGRLDFTRDDMVQHFQDFPSPQALATGASQLTVGMHFRVYVHVRSRFLTSVLYSQSRLEKKTIYLKTVSHLGEKKAGSEHLKTIVMTETDVRVSLTDICLHKAF